MDLADLWSLALIEKENSMFVVRCASAKTDEIGNGVLSSCKNVVICTSKFLNYVHSNVGSCVSAYGNVRERAATTRSDCIVPILGGLTLVFLPCSRVKNWFCSMSSNSSDCLSSELLKL